MSQISVIVPVYNAEKTIAKCLNSIKMQTYKDFEVLIINDSSIDKSAQICEAYCKDDSRFKLITQENTGPSGARNRGVDEANSKYLAFVDSDDYIDPDMLEELYSAAEASSADMAICGYCIERDNVIKKVYSSKYSPGVYSGESLQKIITESFDVGSEHNIPPYSGIRLVKKECMDFPTKLRFNINLYRSEDYLLWNQVFSRINSLHLITNKPFYHYVMNSTSITHGYIKNYWEMSKIIYNELITTFSDKESLQSIKLMLLHRACLSLRIAKCAKDKKTFHSDIEKVLKDKELHKAISSIPLLKGIEKYKTRYLLFKFRLYFIVRILYNYRYIKAH